METLDVNGRRIAAGGGNVDARDFDRINPFVRMMRVKQDLLRHGQVAGCRPRLHHDHCRSRRLHRRRHALFAGARRRHRPSAVSDARDRAHGGEMLQQKIFHFDFFEDPERCSLRHEDVLDRDGPKVVPQRERLMGDRAFAAHPEPKAFARLEETYQRMLEEFQSLCEGRRLFGAAAGVLHRDAGRDVSRRAGACAGGPARQRQVQGVGCTSRTR